MHQIERPRVVARVRYRHGNAVLRRLRQKNKQSQNRKPPFGIIALREFSCAIIRGERYPMPTCLGDMHESLARNLYLSLVQNIFPALGVHAFNKSPVRMCSPRSDPRKHKQLKLSRLLRKNHATAILPRSPLRRRVQVNKLIYSMAPATAVSRFR